MHDMYLKFIYILYIYFFFLLIATDALFSCGSTRVAGRNAPAPHIHIYIYIYICGKKLRRWFHASITEENKSPDQLIQRYQGTQMQPKRVHRHV